jgi:hypothetical protein
MHTPVQGTTSRLSHSAGQSTVVDVPDIIEVDEDEDAENGEGKPEIDIELVQGDINSNLNKKDELISPMKEVGF